MRNTNHVVSRGLLGLVALAALGGGARVANAQEVLTNSPTKGFYGVIGSSQPVSIAGGFVLSDGPWNLLDITVRLGTNATIAGSLWSDNGSGTPGSQIAALNLTGGTPGESESPLTFSPTGTVTLTANTRYWFVARIERGYIRNGSGFSNDGAHGVNSNQTYRIGNGSWAYPSSARLAMTVRGVVPEPSEWAAMGVLGLALGGLVVRKRRTR